MTSTTEAWPPPFRDRLVALLDEYDAAPRGSTDHLLSAYVRACVSSRDAFEMRVAREARRQAGGPEPRENGRAKPDPVLSTAPLYDHDPRPDDTALLAARLRYRTQARTESGP